MPVALDGSRRFPAEPRPLRGLSPLHSECNLITRWLGCPPGGSPSSATTMTGASCGSPAQMEDAAKLLPRVHRVALLSKRWLMGAHQGVVVEVQWAATATGLCSTSASDDSVARSLCSVGGSSWPRWTTGCLPGSHPQSPPHHQPVPAAAAAGTRTEHSRPPTNFPGEWSHFGRPVNGLPRIPLTSGTRDATHGHGHAVAITGQL